MLVRIRFWGVVGIALALLGMACGDDRSRLVVAAEPVSTTSLGAVALSTTLLPVQGPLTTQSARTTLAPAGPSTTLAQSHSLRLTKVTDITGDLASKSIVASGDGYFFAQNMMYRHTISVFGRDYQLVETISDTVDLQTLGASAEPTLLSGAPVEAAFSSDGQYGFVSNYRMYGEDFSSTAGDSCNQGEGQNSYIYRVDTNRLGTDTSPIDAVYEVGSVPKFLAVTPDDSRLLVSNWCSFDLSVIDLDDGALLASVYLGRHPRGIAITSDGGTAYVAVMGSSSVAVLNLSTLEVSWMHGIGSGPRHLVLSPDDATLYATLNGEGSVVAIDLASGLVTKRVYTGSAPRSMVASKDGTALFVVNYGSDTLAMVGTEHFEVLQIVDTAPRPIGITFDPSTREVWVSCYSGVIHVLALASVRDGGS